MRIELEADQVRAFTRVGFAGGVFTLLMGVFYELVGAPVRIEFVVAAGYFATLALWLMTRSYAVLAIGTLGVTLIGALLIQYQAGGVGPSGVNAIWTIGVALSSAVFQSGRWAKVWIPTFVLGVSAEALCEVLIPPHVAPRPAWVPIAVAAANVLGLGLLSSVVLTWLVKQRDDAALKLEQEHERSERLLHITLPSSVAERLKAKPGTIADRLDATILFADIVGFTPLARRETPERIVQLLDQLFSTFDALVERHGLEKIKTIGDAYMAAGGVPLPRADHAVAVASLALDMLDAVKRLRESGGPDFHIRIGLHTGSVIAGVIGRQRLAYDLWGDVVNIASRMESHGEPDEIQCTDEVRAALGDAFELTPRGTISLKGLGEIRAWRLVGRRG